MKAVTIQFADKGALAIAEVATPATGSRDIKIRVQAAALNRADLLQRKGLYPAPAGIPTDIPGLECAGEVCEVGSQVTRFKAGDRVMALMGGAAQAEYVVCEEDCAALVPPGMSLVEAAAIPEAFITAYDALLHQGRFSLGDTVLIHAAGSGVGTAAVQLAQVAGAAAIYGTASAAKHEQLRQLGLTVGIDYRSEEFASAILAKQPQGVDLVLDFVGGGYWQQNVKCLKSQGRLVLIGFLGTPKLPAETSLAPLLQKRIEVVGTVLRSRSRAEKALLVQALADKLLPLFVSGRLKAIIARTFPFGEVEQAYRYLETNQNFGKVVLAWE